MSNIYSAKFMNEASATLRDKVFYKPVNETYLFSVMDILREMNSVINKETEKLYVHIAEAESKEDENKLFADYYFQFKTIFQEFANKVQQMKSRMVMAVENKVETWEDLYKDDEYISCFDKEFNYSGYEFLHMEDANYPRLNLHKLYQKEFDYIGMLMQNTTMNASPSAKLKIIATVCNNFSNCSGDKNWIKDLIHDMIDIDDKEISRSYSECIYNSLRNKYDITVNRGMLYTCKENLSDYEDIISAAAKLCDNLLYDLDKVANDISSYLFRNKDNKLKIKTDTDGVIDRDYRLDTYSMNQLDLFLKTKVTQIKKLLNVYSIAIGIKFDTAIDYINQNIDILRTAKDYSPETEEAPEEVDDIQDVEDDADTEEPEEIGDDESDDELGNTDELDDDYDGDGDTDSEDVDHEEDDDDIDDVTDSDDENKEAIEEEPTNDEVEEPFDVDNEDFEESYLFESELFELEMMCETYNMHESIKSALLLEEETPATTSNKSTENKSSVGLDNAAKTADKANVWQKIISKLISLWNKFKEIVTTQSKLKVDYLKKNEKFINTSVKGVEGTVTLEYTPDITALENLKIEDLNYNTMEQYLVSEEAFCTQYYNTYYANKGEKSFSDFMKEKILKGERKIDPKDGKFVKEAFMFCEDYMTKVDIIKRQTDIIEKAQRVAKDVSKVQESTIKNDASMYFREMKDDTTQEENPNGNTSESKLSSDKSAKLAIYFKVSSQVLAAKMTMYQKLFNEYFKFCNWHIVKAGGPAYVLAGQSKENTGSN